MQRFQLTRTLTRTLTISVGGLALVFAMLLSAMLPQGTALAASNSLAISAKLTHNMPLYKEAKKLSSSGVLPCLSSTTLPLCYSPQQIRKAYNIDTLINKGYTGKGQTIVIIDDYQSPTITSDLALFDKIFSLPNPKFNIIAPQGFKPFDPTDPAASGFAAEISLDVEWSHAVAPGATIDLVLGNPANSTIQGQIQALADAMKSAADANLGGVYSLSVGAGETCYSAAQLNEFHAAFAEAKYHHSTVYVSSGDNGSAVDVCDSNGNPVNVAEGVNYPASDPLVSGVGGTTLSASTTNGKYQSETTWNESTVGAGATGGGFSVLFSRPAYQNGVPGIEAMRGVPDVAYNADPLTGVPIVTSSLLPGATVIIPIGGTSAGAPQWAGVTAAMSQYAGKRLGFLNNAFYKIGMSKQYAQGFNDITTGNNAFTVSANGQTVTIPGFNAGTGWDATTGWGSPKAFQLAKLLAEYAE